MTDLRALHIALRKAKLAREDMAAHICDLQDRIAAAQRQPDQEPDWYLGDGVTEPATRSETALVIGIPAAIVLAVVALAWGLS
jgi:hypothetical protein